MHRVTASSTSITTNWSPPTDPYGVVKSYNVLYQRLQYLECGAGAGEQTTDSVPATGIQTYTYTKPGLNPYSRYTVIVRPVNGAGAGIVSTKQINTKTAGMYS